MLDATIEASAQQTRFDPLAVGATNKRELDLKDVTVTIRETGRDLLARAIIKLNSGVRYLLHGENGSGKSTILRALGKRLIPGIADDLRISYLEQREGDAVQDYMTALDTVISSDAVRSEALQRRKCKRVGVTRREGLLNDTTVLQEAIDNLNDPNASIAAVKQIEHEDQLKKLELAQREAELRSGARGIKARKALKEQEKAVEVSFAS